MKGPIFEGTMNDDKLSDRNSQILKALIERYIREGVPVGSKSLVEESGLNVSPATVRNVMVDLETRGLVSAPHTSAGRIPTGLGYRMFVDSLITIYPIDNDYLHNLRTELDPQRSANELVETASNLLSQLTAQAGVVTLPKVDKVTLRQVEFLSLSGNRVLVILVINQKEVENRIIQTDRAYSDAELQRAAHFINERYSGLDLEQVKEQLLSAMRADKESIGQLMQAMIDVAGATLAGGDGGADCVVAGQSNLIDSLQSKDMERLKDLFDAFHYKKDILALMSHCVDADGIRIFIGEESGYELFEDYSVVTAPYRDGSKSIGVLGIIGPTRMAYASVIPVVDVTAKMLSAALSNT
ncbi:MAG: heat-inducible transcriptional repressor HrcA [Pseudomonadales bacterium]